MSVLLGDVQAHAELETARAYLSTTFSFTGGDFARVDGGQVVTRTLTASDPREVAVLGVVRVGVTPLFYVTQLGDIASFKKDEAVLAIGAFGDPPTAADISTLTLDESDLRNLRECRPGRCGMQLPGEAITRFNQGVDWRRPDAGQRADRLMREMLVDYAAAYQREGAAASMIYADERQTMDVRREFASLIDSEIAGWPRFPKLQQHLMSYPLPVAPDVRDVLYWSQEKVSRRTVVSVTHLAISRMTEASPFDYAIATKQIYGSHYYDASLGVTVLLQDRAAAKPATYVVYLNRSRVDIFDGLLGDVARRLVTSKAKSTVAEQLGRLQQRLEREFARVEAQ